MAPPAEAGAGGGAGAAAPPAVSVCPDPAAARTPGRTPLPVLRRRADFLSAARGRRQGTPGFLLQARDRGDDGPARVGFTCSRRVGNAVARNRARRRLREVARLVLPGAGRPGWDYVLVGRRTDTADRPFAALLCDLRAAMERVHR